MATRYSRITLEYSVEFDREEEQSLSIEPTLAQCDDPRFVAFLEWWHEIKRAERESVLIAAIPPLPSVPETTWP